MAITLKYVQTTDRNINQLQQNIKQGIEPLFSNQTGTWQATLTGCTTTVVATGQWEQSVQGGQVSLNIPLLSGTSNSTTATITGLPVNLWPTTLQTVCAAIKDNGTIAASILNVGTDGTITLEKSFTGAAFTASGGKGIIGQTITYIVGV